MKWGKIGLQKNSNIFGVLYFPYIWGGGGGGGGGGQTVDARSQLLVDAISTNGSCVGLKYI